MCTEGTKIKFSYKSTSNWMLNVCLTFSLVLCSFAGFAQLNAEGNPPDEVLRTLTIKHPGAKASNWSWSSKYVEYVGYFEKDGFINKVHINGYGKWTKTITYLKQQDLPHQVVTVFENKTSKDAVVSEFFIENSKDWGKQYKIRFILSDSDAEENEFTYSSDFKLVAERTYKKNHIPYVVVEKFDETYHNASKEKWTFNADLFAFEVNFKLNKENKTAYFTANGEWMWSEKIAPKNEIPEDVKATIEKSLFEDWKVDNIAELHSNQIAKCYRVKFKSQKEKKYLIFSEDGDLLNKSDLQ